MPRIVKAPANVVKAAANGKVGVLRAWLSSDAADVNAANRAGDTLLMIAAQHEQVVELLLQHGAEINKQNSKGRTALMAAAMSAPALSKRRTTAGWPWMAATISAVPPLLPCWLISAPC